MSCNSLVHHALSAVTSFFSVPVLPPLIIPVLLAATSPTLAPGGAYLEMVDGWPICCWLPPPCGCSTGFIATPLTTGQTFLFLAYLWYWFPAFKIGLSVLYPPAIIPIIALASPGSVFLEPDGNLTLVFVKSSECPIIIALVPLALENFPLSPALPSTLQIIVPSGI